MKDYSKENIKFIMRTELFSGDGIALKLADHLKAQGWDKIGLVIDKGLFDNNNYVKEIIANLEKGLSQVEILVNGMPEPTYDYLEEVKQKFAGRELQAFVGIGGGSTLDLTKGLATLMTNSGPAISYRGFPKLKQVPLPVVALPSTAGTGSEVTPYAVFIDQADKWKFGINSEYNYPRMGFYDPRLLDSCPLKIYASAGMDAMTHTLESFVAKNATYLSRIYSREAFRLLFVNLKKIAAGDRSQGTKLSLLIGSGLAGVALMNSGAGPAGALSYPLGVYFDVPHGLAGSVFLPEVIRYNVANGYEEYAQLYDLVHEPSALTDKEKSLKFAEEIKMLSDALGIPTSLKGFGVKNEQDLRSIIDNSTKVRTAFEQNPVPFGDAEIERTVFALK